MSTAWKLDEVPASNFFGTKILRKVVLTPSPSVTKTSVVQVQTDFYIFGEFLKIQNWPSSVFYVFLFKFLLLQHKLQKSVPKLGNINSSKLNFNISRHPVVSSVIFDFSGILKFLQKSRKIIWISKNWAVAYSYAQVKQGQKPSKIDNFTKVKQH